MPFYSLDCRWYGGKPCIRVDVNDQTGSFLLDTGAGASLLCSGFASESRVSCNRSSPIQTTTATSQVAIYKGGVGNVSLGNEDLTDIPFIIKDCAFDADDIDPGTIDGYIGMPWFTGRRVRFPAGGDRILFTPAVENS